MLPGDKPITTTGYKFWLCLLGTETKNRERHKMMFYLQLGTQDLGSLPPAMGVLPSY